jgi:virulence factor Mce-like protein
MSFQPSRNGRRSRRRPGTASPRGALLNGLAVLAVMAVFGWIAVSAYDGVPTRDYGKAFAEVPRVGNLLEHDQVRIAGVRVGQVSGTTTGARGDARIELQLEPGTKLPKDTQVVVRANGLLGARYVQLIPGTSAETLPEGATIRGGENSITLGVPEALDTFDAETRGALGDVLGELGRGLTGLGGRLNDTIRVNAPRQRDFQALIDEILARPGAARRLLPGLRAGLQPLDAARDDLARSFDPAARALAPFVAERTALQNTLELAPSTLAAADRGLTNGRRLLQSARAVATAASRTLPPAPAGLAEAARLLEESDTPLRRTAALLRTAGPAIPAALRITDAARPLLRPLHEALSDLAPMLTRIGRHGCDIINTGTVFRSMTGFGGTGEGPNGPAMQFRLQAIPSPETIGAPDNSGLVQRDGYPAPCKYVATEYPQVFTRPSALAARGGARP